MTSGSRTSSGVTAWTATPSSSSSSQTQAEDSSVERSQDNWDRIKIPGGRKLYKHAVKGFILASTLGLVFILLGAIFLGDAKKIHEDGGSSLAMVWCIVGIVTGALMVGGSIILGNILVSNKWRRNQPSYMAPRGYAARQRAERLREPDLQEPESDQPPPYQRRRPPRTSVYVISSDGDVNVTLTTPAGSVMTPPSYEDVVLSSPPGYSTSDPLEATNANSNVDTMSSESIHTNDSVTTQGHDVPTVSTNLPSSPPTYEESIDPNPSTDTSL